MDNPQLSTSVPLLKALKNCIDTLRPCLQGLRSVGDAKLESHIEIMATCFKNCKMTLELVESNPSKALDILPDCQSSCKKCMKVCKQIDHYVFKKAMVALNDCIVELDG